MKEHLLAKLIVVCWGNNSANVTHVQCSLARIVEVLSKKINILLQRRKYQITVEISFGTKNIIYTGV